VNGRRPPSIVLDMNSSESPAYGEQNGSAHNGHFGCGCYHPLFVFNQLGDVGRCVRRSGNVRSVGGWRSVLEPVIARYWGIVKAEVAMSRQMFAISLSLIARLRASAVPA
jgi:hypothetical protein